MRLLFSPTLGKKLKQQVTVTSGPLWRLSELSCLSVFLTRCVTEWGFGSILTLVCCEKKSQPQCWRCPHTTWVLTDNSRKERFFSFQVLSETNPIIKKPRIDHCLWIIRGNPPPYINPPTHTHTYTHAQPYPYPSLFFEWHIHTILRASLLPRPISVTSVVQPTHYWQASPCRLHQEPIQFVPIKRVGSLQRLEGVV